MLNLRRATWSCAALLTLAGTSACGGSGGGFKGADGGKTDATGDSPTLEDAPASQDVINLGEASGDGGSSDAAAAVVYAESKDTLYVLDPVTKAIKTVGAFTGCTEVIDIALDKDSNMYATTFDGLYTIDRTTAACTLVASGSNYPNSLSFVPAGTLDPMVEALVGYVGGTYVHIDTKSGAITMLGSIGQSYSSSGDIVSVKGGGTYLTVKGGPKGTCNDCLIEVDPSTGAFLFYWGPVQHTDTFGLGFWGGAVYGFDTAGDIFEIQFHGEAIEITTIPFPDAPSGLSWFGAGSTTSAPLAPPK